MGEVGDPRVSVVGNFRYCSVRNGQIGLTVACAHRVLLLSGMGQQKVQSSSSSSYLLQGNGLYL